MLSIIPGTMYADGNTITVSTMQELASVAEDVNSGNDYAGVTVILANDIVMNRHLVNAKGELNEGSFTTWTPIGTPENPFRGNFDGNGCTVSGLYINDDGQYKGLFGVLSGAQIRNVYVEDSYIFTSDHAGVDALPAVVNPFTDCNDIEMLKAYNVGITNGMSKTEFNPDGLLNREQAATMLTRVFKRSTIPGWSMKNDDEYTLNYTAGAKFADDSLISDWAKESVYFMNANKIILGFENNCFAPKNLTEDDEARGYANATIEQALIIAVRMVNNLK